MTMICNQCGVALPDKAKFCPECGASTGYTKLPDRAFIDGDTPAQIDHKRKFSFTDINAGWLFIILLSLSGLLFIGYVAVSGSLEQRRLHPPGVCDSMNPDACYANSIDIGTYLDQHRGEHNQILWGKWKNLNSSADIKLITFNSDGTLSGYKLDASYAGNFEGEYATFEGNRLTMKMNGMLHVFVFNGDGNALTLREDDGSENTFERTDE
jgi:hypothetical protein